MNPSDLRYTQEHEWARIEGDRATIGITEFAQDQLGDIVYVDLPAAGTTVAAGTVFGEVESTKSVSDLYSPVTGTIVEANATLADRPETVNADPYGDGWLVVIQLDAGGETSELLDSDAYAALVANQ